jgi:predicted P-loop ATPase
MELKYKQIQQESELKPEINSGETNLDNLITRYSKLFTDAGDNELQRRDVIYLSCSELLQLRDSAQEIFIDHFIETFKWLKKRDFSTRMIKMKKKNDEDENNNQAVAIPEVDRIENFLSEIFDVRFNVISNKYEYKNIDNNSEFDELDEFIIARRLRKKHVDISVAYIREIIKSDFTPNYNPIEDYFKKLETWDGEDHIEKLAFYIQVNDYDRERFNRHFKKMFVRIIAAAFGRAVNKRCMIFVGGQDAGKTTFERWLCPDALKAYYSEDVDFNNKDGLISMGSNFMIVIDELANLPRNDLNQMKSVMSKDMIKVRLPYGHRDSLIKRRCSFLANTNEEEFLSDPTGNVRWIAFFIKEKGINWNYKKDFNIDKIWAQAYYLLNSGFHYDMDSLELEENERSNIQFITRTTELELIPRFYLRAEKQEKDAQFWQATDFYNDLVEIFERGKLSINIFQIGKALRSLRFNRTSKYNHENGISQWGYWIKYTEYYTELKKRKNTLLTTRNKHNPLISDI